MSDKVFVGNQAMGLETSPAFAPYSKVVLWYEDEKCYTAGDDTGRVLEADCPWATQAMADNLLATVKGYEYKPYLGQGALLDPAAELGDGVTIGGMYGPLAAISTTFDAMCAADIEAPEDKEVDHEYPYLTPAERALKRKVTLGTSYYGTRITRAKGLESVRLDADGNELAKAVFNADELAFYAGNEQALYFDPTTKRYMFRGDIYVTGNINLSGGTITWGKNKPDTSVTWAKVRDALKSAAALSASIITIDSLGAPNIYGGNIFGCNIYAGNSAEGQPFAKMTGNYFGVFPDGNTNAIAQLGAISGGARLVLGVGGGNDPDVETTVERFRIDKYRGEVNMVYQTSWDGAENMDVGFTFLDDGTIKVSAKKLEGFYLTFS